MQDLIKQLQDKAGLTEEQAHKSLQTIKEYIQSKLPPMMQGMVDNFMGMQSADTDDFMEPADKKEPAVEKIKVVAEEAKEKIEDFAEDAKEEAEAFAKEASEKIGEWADKAENAAQEAIGKLKDMIKDTNGEKK